MKEEIHKDLHTN